MSPLLLMIDELEADEALRPACALCTYHFCLCACWLLDAAPHLILFSLQAFSRPRKKRAHICRMIWLASASATRHRCRHIFGILAILSPLGFWLLILGAREALAMKRIRHAAFAYLHDGLISLACFSVGRKPLLFCCYGATTISLPAPMPP